MAAEAQGSIRKFTGWNELYLYVGTYEYQIYFLTYLICYVE